MFARVTFSDIQMAYKLQKVFCNREKKRESEKEKERFLTSNNCCHLLNFMLMQSIVMDLVRLSKYWKWHLKDAYEYCSPSKKLITSTFSLYLRPNKKYVFVKWGRYLFFGSWLTMANYNHSSIHWNICEMSIEHIL